MITLSHEDHIANVGRQVEQLRSVVVPGADLAAGVPTCPDWTLEDLVRHVGGALRWAALLVARRATADLPDEEVPGFDGPEARGDAAALDAWLAESGRLLVEALSGAAPDTPVWSWYEERTAGFWARRMSNELAVHRADAAFAAGQPYEVAPEVAADTIEEWLGIVRFAQRDPDDADGVALRLGGRTLHLHATDAPAGLDAEWLVELADESVRWSRRHGRADVALRGPLTEVMLAFQRRTAPDAGSLEVLGDRALLDLWLSRTRWA
ncbi:maleylpyruvate isomerase family mycothiol-dependent enzyme [Streptomyces sp. NPDC002734]|uniref:maleylpyruvate isomerase family mycothiol-dependent enzyme n=1 Tax=Streptomyces sp. NPDC002734 TaxID=3154426 RepID=UPI00332E7B26